MPKHADKFFVGAVQHRKKDLLSFEQFRKINKYTAMKTGIHVIDITYIHQ